MTEAAPAGRCRYRLCNQPGWRVAGNGEKSLFLVNARSRHELMGMLAAGSLFTARTRKHTHSHNFSKGNYQEKLAGCDREVSL
jgi:hypothetical protein